MTDREDAWKIARPLAQRIFDDFVTVSLRLDEDRQTATAVAHFRIYQAACLIQEALLAAGAQAANEELAPINKTEAP